VYGGPERGGWIETVKRGAFDTTLAAKPDVCFLINHEGMPLARTRSGTLTLRADNTGLESEATVDRRDPEGQALEVKMERGDLDQMSFGFRVTRQSWNEDYTERDITEVNLDNGDVSIVNWPANPATSMSIVSARSAVAVLREMEMAELRGELGDITPDELREAQARLGELVEALDPRTRAQSRSTSSRCIREDPRGPRLVARGLLASRPPGRQAADELRRGGSRP
jgi:HK97 family phage prohead protease